MRSRRIRIGAVVILASVIVMLVLGAMARDPIALSLAAEGHHDGRSWLDKIGDRGFGDAGTHPFRPAFSYSIIFAFGMVGVGIGACIVLWAVTTPKP